MFSQGSIARTSHPPTFIRGEIMAGFDKIHLAKRFDPNDVGAILRAADNPFHIKLTVAPVDLVAVAFCSFLGASLGMSAVFFIWALL